MEKLFRFNLKKTVDEGFTTLEVLVSIVIALAFVGVAMQSFVLGVAIKIQAQEKQRANQLIQEDLELLSDRASVLAVDHNNKCNPVAGGGNTAYENGYANALWDDIEDPKFKPKDTFNEATSLLSSGDGTRIALTRNHVSGANSVAPHRTLKINYQVREIKNDNTLEDDIIANRYVEVTPDAALRCP